MKIEKLWKVKTKEEARKLAIDWQNWQSEQNLTYFQVIEWQILFREIGKKFGLSAEFKENGII